MRLELLVVVVPGVLDAVLADGDLDALAGKVLAQRGRLDDTGEFLCGKDLEGIRESGGHDLVLGAVELVLLVFGRGLVRANVDKGDFQAVGVSKIEGNMGTKQTGSCPRCGQRGLAR